MKPITIKTLSTLVLTLCLNSTANAALVSRLGGQAIYDSDLNITWLADGNAAAGTVFDNGTSSTDGRMTWANANNWAASLIISGFTGWRLPVTLQPDSSCAGQLSGEGFGNNCTGSEMGHLYYNELGGTAGNVLQASSELALFSGTLQSSSYWSDTEVASDTTFAWRFAFDGGSQFGRIKTTDFHALAVRPGDVAAVPVPAAVWLMGSALLGLAGFRRKVTS